VWDGVPAFSTDFNVTSDESECLDLHIISNAITPMFDFLPFRHDDRGIKSENQNSAEHGSAAIMFRQTVFRREVHDSRRDNFLLRRCAPLVQQRISIKNGEIAAFSKKNTIFDSYDCWIRGTQTELTATTSWPRRSSEKFRSGGKQTQ
jgi:hypothetical protein